MRVRKGGSASVAGEGDDSPLHRPHGGLLSEEPTVLRLQGRRTAVFRGLGPAPAEPNPPLRQQRLRAVPVLRTGQRQEELSHRYGPAGHIFPRFLGGS